MAAAWANVGPSLFPRCPRLTLRLSLPGTLFPADKPLDAALETLFPAAVELLGTARPLAWSAAWAKGDVAPAAEESPPPLAAAAELVAVELMLNGSTSRVVEPSVERVPSLVSGSVSGDSSGSGERGDVKLTAGSASCELPKLGGALFSACGSERGGDVETRRSGWRARRAPGISTGAGGGFSVKDNSQVFLVSFVYINWIEDSYPAAQIAALKSGHCCRRE